MGRELGRRSGLRSRKGQSNKPQDNRAGSTQVANGSSGPDIYFRSWSEIPLGYGSERVVGGIGAVAKGNSTVDASPTISRKTPNITMASMKT